MTQRSANICIVVIGILPQSTARCNKVKLHWPRLVLGWVTVLVYSVDSPSDETLNRGPLSLLLWRQYEFHFGINLVQFSFIFFFQSEYQALTLADQFDYPIDIPMPLEITVHH